jgi:hypothetical protein
MTNKNIVAWKATTHNPIRINAQKIKDLQMGEGICRSLKPRYKKVQKQGRKEKQKKTLPHVGHLSGHQLNHLSLMHKQPNVKV